MPPHPQEAKNRTKPDDEQKPNVIIAIPCQYSISECYRRDFNACLPRETYAEDTETSRFGEEDTDHTEASCYAYWEAVDAEKSAGDADKFGSVGVYGCEGDVYEEFESGEASWEGG